MSSVWHRAVARDRQARDRVGNRDQQDTERQQDRGGGVGDRAAPRQHLLRGNQRGDERHPGDAHHPERKERRHQRPAAPHTPRAVLGAHLQRARQAIPPRAEKEAERAPAMPEADGLQRRELVGGGNHEDSACHPSAGAIPGQRVAEQTAARLGDRRRPAVRPPSRSADSRTRRPAARAGDRFFVMREYSATVGETDGNIIAAIITSQTPRNQPSVPRSVPGPVVHAPHAIDGRTTRQTRRGRTAAR